MSLPPTKRRKVDNSAAKAVKLLENELTDAINAYGSLNALADLVALTRRCESAEDTSKAIYALYRLFVLLVTEGKLFGEADEAQKVVRAWIWDQLNAYVDILTGLLKDEEKSLRISALQILLSIQKHLSTAVSKSSKSPQFHVSHFKRIATALIQAPPSPRSANTLKSNGKTDQDVLDAFYDSYLSVYDDIRWFFLREAGTLLTQDKTSILSENLLDILERLSTFPTEASELNSWWVEELGVKPPKPKGSKKGKSNDTASDDDEPESEEQAGDDDDWRKFFEDEEPSKKSNVPATGVRVHTLTIHQSLHSLRSHRAVFTRTWLSLLPRLLGSATTNHSKTLASRALNVLHQGVMPHLTRAILVMDWVSECVDMGGSVGLLALNALFILMRDYNLDYPTFYTRLYAFIDRDVLHLKHRSRFFRLTELFLSSTHLPATLLASFVKRLARCALFAPPAAMVMTIPFIYNILKRHPALMVMIHSDSSEGSDPFLPDEPNPQLTRALESSLWEIHSLRSHYHTAVSTLAKIFEEAFTKPNYAMEDFLDSTYSTLLDTELKRNIKKEPAMAVDPILRKKRSAIDTPTDLVQEILGF